MIPKFSHELYGLRVVDKLAKRDREEPGLDLTWEVRDGIVSHCGEDFKTCKLIPQAKKSRLEWIKDQKQVGYPATLEGCIVRLIDKVFYDFLTDMKDAYPKTAPKELMVFDFIAGMTDSFAIRSFQELFVPMATV